MKVLSILLLVATALGSFAVPVNITVDSAGAYLQNGGTDPGQSLADREFYQAIVQIYKESKNTRSANFTFLDEMVSNWNTNKSGDSLVSPIQHGNKIHDVTNDPGTGPSVYTTRAGYQYVVFHLGGTGGSGGMGGSGGSEVVHGDSCGGEVDDGTEHGESCGGSGGRGGDEGESGWWAAWYLGGESIVFEESLVGAHGGLTSARYFNPIPSPGSAVPDGGRTLVTLGLAVLALLLVRKVGAVRNRFMRWLFPLSA